MLGKIFYLQYHAPLLGLPEIARTKAIRVSNFRLADANNAARLHGTTSKQAPLTASRQLVFCQASPHHSQDFRKEEYVEATLGTVESGKPTNIIILKCPHDKVLPVYIGEFESTALKSIGDQQQKNTRPLTYDFMKETLILLGFKVTKVRIHALVDNTYHARVHFNKGSGTQENAEEIDIDARPSDAINLALRFDAPVYVNIKVVDEMGQPASKYEALVEKPRGLLGRMTETRAAVFASCKKELDHFKDPTILHKLQLQIAISSEDYVEAARIRNVIEKILSTDRPMSLVVAMESALRDDRIEEAARIRDELRALRSKQHA